MTTPIGIFGGMDALVRQTLGLVENQQLHHRASLSLLRDGISKNRLAALVIELYRIIASNRSARKPSRKNWRWDVQTKISDRNGSPEVLIERAIAQLAEQGLLVDPTGRWQGSWCNQIPVAAGMVDSLAAKRAAVDLARMSKDQLDLYELKWESDTPLYAAIEILRYGLAYLYCRAHAEEFGYSKAQTMQARSITLNVLAPADYYRNADLAWLEEGLDAGFRNLTTKLFGDTLSGSFRFLILPIGPERPFTTGGQVKASCSTPPGPAARSLIDALFAVRPAYQPEAIA